MAGPRVLVAFWGGRLGVPHGCSTGGGLPLQAPKIEIGVHTMKKYEDIEGTNRCNADTGEKIEGRICKVREVVSTTKEVSNGTLFWKIWAGSGIERLENMEIVFLIRIMTYVDARDNTIRRNGEAMNVKEMGEVTGIGYSRLSETVKSMVEKKVMGKHSTGIVEYIGRRSVIYSVNPYIICKGKMVNKKVCEYYTG